MDVDPSVDTVPVIFAVEGFVSEAGVGWEGDWEQPAKVMTAIIAATTRPIHL